MRLVIKIGSQVVANTEGLDRKKIEKITSDIAELLKKGHEVVLVCSGAVRSGIPKLPKLDTPLKKQVWASIGQAMVMTDYASSFEKYGYNAGQILILRDDFTNRESYTNLVAVANSLIEAKVVPIINENNVMETKELALGDNDILSAMISVAINADKLIILTNQDGLYNGDPTSNPDAKLITTVEDVDFEIEKFCSKGKTALGYGGMISKVRAAKHAVNSGIEVVICNGTKNGIIPETLKNTFTGTRFIPNVLPKMSEKKRWMMSAKGIGSMTIDTGAIKALQSGKSLLLPGIFSIKGDFDKGEIIEIISKTGQTIAYGKVNYSAIEIQKAITTKNLSEEKDKRFLEKEIIHRNYMIVSGK